MMTFPHTRPARTITTGYLNFETVEEWFVGVALALTVASQLRFNEFGVGAGEIALMAWASAVFIGRKAAFMEALPRQTLRFALALLIIGVFATANGVIAGMYQPDNLRDGAAMFANLVLVIAMALTFHPQLRARRLLTKLGISLAALNLAAAILPQFGISFGSVAFYTDSSHRLFGFSANPNQVAMASAVSIGAVLVGHWPWRPIVNWPAQAVCCAAALYAGYLSDSDAFKAAVAAYIAVLIFSLGLIAYHHRQTKLFFSYALLGVFGGATLAVIFTTTDKADFIKLIIHDLYVGGDDHGSVRMILWRNGLSAIADSHLIGYGPGAFSGIMGAFENTESHNSLIDLGTNFGVLGMALIVVMFFEALRRALFSQPKVAAFITMMIVYILFHHVLRHFVFWGTVLLIISINARPKAMPARAGIGRMVPNASGISENSQRFPRGTGHGQN